MSTPAANTKPTPTPRQVDVLIDMFRAGRDHAVAIHESVKANTTTAGGSVARGLLAEIDLSEQIMRGHLDAGPVVGGAVPLLREFDRLVVHVAALGFELAALGILEPDGGG